METKSPLEILIAARKRSERPELWTKEAAARDAGGVEVEPTDPTARCWCAWGAVEAEKPAELVLPGAFAIDALCEALRYVRRADPDQYDEPDDDDMRDVGTINDEAETTHADVLKAYDLAIAADGDDSNIRMYGLSLLGGAR